MAERYSGQLNLPADNLANNPGCVLNLIDHVKKTVDYSQWGSENQKAAMKKNVELALKKIAGPAYHRKMVLANFDISHQIGYGSYGKVWKAHGKYTGDVAIKQLPVNVRSYSRNLKERDILIAVEHERICKLQGAFFDRDVFLVMELCHGSVATLVKKIDRKNAVRFSVHLLEGLRHIHGLNIVHADIKPDNCLISTNNSLVITDFGSAFLLDEATGEHFIKVEESVGSYPYQDIAALKYDKFQKQTDVFAAGCVMFEMDAHAGLLLYPKRDTHPRSLYIDAIENGRVSNLHPHVDPACGMQREMISDRALKSNLGFLIQKLISDHSRLTAEEALVDMTLNSILGGSGISRSTPSSEAVYVTREYNIDTSENFKFLSDRNESAKMETAFLSFYFDNTHHNSQHFISDTSSDDDDDNDGEDGEHDERGTGKDSDSNNSPPALPRNTQSKRNPSKSDSDNSETPSGPTDYKRQFTPYDSNY